MKYVFLTLLMIASIGLLSVPNAFAEEKFDLVYNPNTEILTIDYSFEAENCLVIFSYPQITSDGNFLTLDESVKCEGILEYTVFDKLTDNKLSVKGTFVTTDSGKNVDLKRFELFVNLSGIFVPTIEACNDDDGKTTYILVRNDLVFIATSPTCELQKQELIPEPVFIPNIPSSITFDQKTSRVEVNLNLNAKNCGYTMSTYVVGSNALYLPGGPLFEKDGTIGIDCYTGVIDFDKNQFTSASSFIMDISIYDLDKKVELAMFVLQNGEDFKFDFYNEETCKKESQFDFKIAYLVINESFIRTVNTDCIVTLITLGQVIDPTPYPINDPTITPVTEPVAEPTPKKTKSGGGGCSGDCTPPTLGLDNNGKLLVRDGITINGHSEDGGYFHTEYPMQFTEIGKENKITLKYYDNSGPQNIEIIQLGLGIKEIGTSISQSQTLLELHMDFFTNDIDTPLIEKLVIVGDKSLVSNVSATAELRQCNDYYSADSDNFKVSDLLDDKEAFYSFLISQTCLQVEFTYTYDKIPESVVLASNAIDYKRNTFNNYFNDGLTVIDPNPPVPEIVEPEPVKACTSSKSSIDRNDCPFTLLKTYEEARASYVYPDYSSKDF